MTRIALTLALLTLACCGERIVYVYPDTSAEDAGPTADAGAPQRDAEVAPDAEGVDAPRGTCEPDRTPGTVSHSDCRSVSGRTICDAVSEQCVSEPVDFCGACASNADCANFDLTARCTFIEGGGRSNNDSACLSPCTVAADCDFLRRDWINVACMPLGAGSFCLPDFGHCRDHSGSRR